MGGFPYEDDVAVIISADQEAGKELCVEVGRALFVRTVQAPSFADSVRPCQI